MKTSALGGAIVALGFLAAPAFSQQIDLTGVATGQPPSAQELAASWMAAYNQHDADAIGGLYTEDARLYMHGQASVAGRDAIQSFWAADMVESNPLTVMNVTDPVVGFDMILVHGNYQVIDRDTGVPVGQGRFAHIWVQDVDGEWRLDRDLWNQPTTAGASYR